MLRQFSHARESQEETTMQENKIEKKGKGSGLAAAVGVKEEET